MASEQDQIPQAPNTSPAATPQAVPPTPVPSKPGAVSQVPPPTPAAAPSLAQRLNQTQAQTVRVPKTPKRFNTKTLGSGFFHCCIYSETHARKSVTAAQFGSPEDVRIVLTRRPEQLIPLRDLGYEVALVEDEASLLFALQYPEHPQVFGPEWAKRPNRTLVLDDMSECIGMLLSGAEDTLASERNGREVKDPRRTYSRAGDTLHDTLKIVLAKPQHFIGTAMSKVKQHPITDADLIGPDLPPSMMNLLLTEMEFVFYIDTTKWLFVTDRTRLLVKLQVENKEITKSREIFAKNKVPLSAKGLITLNEKMDLAAIWHKVVEGKLPASKVGK